MAHRHGGPPTAHHHHEDAPIHQARLYGFAMRLWGSWGRRWRAGLVRQLDLRPGHRVLDVASGTGQLAFGLAQAVVPGGSVDGVDAAAEMVTYATQRGGRLGLPVTFQTGRAQALPFADDDFDAVTVTLALHHVAFDERWQAVQEIWRVLKPGGRLLVADLQEPKRGPLGRLTRLLFSHALEERSLGQAESLATSLGFVDVVRGATTISWLGVVTARKPAA